MQETVTSALTAESAQRQLELESVEEELSQTKEALGEKNELLASLKREVSEIERTIEQEQKLRVEFAALKKRNAGLQATVEEVTAEVEVQAIQRGRFVSCSTLVRNDTTGKVAIKGSAKLLATREAVGLTE